MNLWKTLAKYQNPKYSFSKTEEYRFFLLHRDILIKYEKFAHLYELNDNEFDIFRANIIIHSHLNKINFEAEVKSLKQYMAKTGKKFDKAKFNSALKERMVDAPYYQEDKNKIYLPFFSRSINLVYLKEPEKLLTYPYSELEGSYSESIIDPGDIYGAELFNSFFTRFVKVGTNGKEVAYFHYDTNCIYIVNSQGRLDVKIALFDKYIKKPNSSHMLERLKPVAEAYFNNDRGAFINSLLDNSFISNKMLYIIKKNS